MTKAPPPKTKAARATLSLNAASEEELVDAIVKFPGVAAAVDTGVGDIDLEGQRHAILEQGVLSLCLYDWFRGTSIAQAQEYDL